MILQLAPDAPLIARAAAGAALVLHVGGGLTGIAAGWTAILAPKGERLHRVAGTVFFLAMLTMSGVAAIVAPMLPAEQWTNTMAGVFTFYLIATAWATVRRPEGEIGRFERLAVMAPLGLAVLAVALGATGVDRGPTGGAVYGLAAIAVVAAIGDLRLIRRGGISGVSRISRHLWRMTLGLFVATGSFFLGQPKHVPAFIKDSGANVALTLAVLALLAFWLVRVRFPRTPKAPVLAPAE